MNKNQTLHAQWSSVWAMSLCAFVLIASEFMPISLLTPLATDLGISEGSAGQVIAISGLCALLTSLFLTTVMGDHDRKKVLLFLTLLMGISGIIVSCAPNITLLMIGRALIGICIGGFWSMSAATTMRLVPKESVPKALALINGGNALATTIAAPLGSFLGGMIGWRGAFFTIVPIALITFLWQSKSLPDMPARHNAGHRPKLNTVFKLLTQWKATLGMVSVMLFFMGVFSLFTYLRPFLEQQTNVEIKMLSLVLLAVGVAGTLGTLLIGQLLKTRLFSLLIIIPFVMLFLALGLILFGKSLGAVFLLLSFWGFLSTSAPVAWWAWLSQTFPNDAEASGGLMVAVIQLAITLGAALGGLLFDGYGYEITFVFSAIILGIAALMAGITARYTHKTTLLNT